MKLFFTADTHFNHTNIIKYCARPFTSTEEHDETLINNYNSVVGKNDTVYHLGDLAFFKCKHALFDNKKYIDLINRLNGQILFIWGNHDKDLIYFHKNISEKLGKKIIFLGHYHKLKFNNEKIILGHYAYRVWDCSHHGSWNLYGHSHGTLPDDPHARAIDVGVDCHNYYPIEFNEVREIMQKKLWQPIDHHGERLETGGVGLSKEEYCKLNRKKQYEQLKKEFKDGGI